MAKPLNAHPQLSIPDVVRKQLWTLDELKAALVGVPSFVYPRRTGLSKLTWFKGWLSKNQPVCSPGPEILRAPQILRTPQRASYSTGVGSTHTVKSWHSARSVHSTKSSYSVNETFFQPFFFCFFLLFLAKKAWNHVFWNMGKMEFPPQTSVVSHTIAFQDFLAKKKSRGREPSRVSVIILWYVMVKPWCGVHGEDQMRPRIVFFFAFQKIIALQGWHRILSVQGR